MLVIICEQLELHIKGPGWCSSVWGLGRTGGGTSSGTSQRHLPEAGATVQVAVVSQSLAPKGRPDLSRMGVVILTDMRIGELAVEDFLGGEGLGSVKRSQVSIYSYG